MPSISNSRLQAYKLENKQCKALNIKRAKLWKNKQKILTAFKRMKFWPPQNAVYKIKVVKWSSGTITTIKWNREQWETEPQRLEQTHGCFPYSYQLLQDKQHNISSEKLMSTLRRTLWSVSQSVNCMCMRRLLQLSVKLHTTSVVRAQEKLDNCVRVNSSAYISSPSFCDESIGSSTVHKSIRKKPQRRIARWCCADVIHVDKDWTVVR